MNIFQKTLLLATLLCCGITNPSVGNPGEPDAVGKQSQNVKKSLWKKTCKMILDNQISSLVVAGISACALVTGRRCLSGSAGTLNASVLQAQPTSRNLQEALEVADRDMADREKWFSNGSLVSGALAVDNEFSRFVSQGEVGTINWIYSLIEIELSHRQNIKELVLQFQPNNSNDIVSVRLPLKIDVIKQIVERPFSVSGFPEVVQEVGRQEPVLIISPSTTPEVNRMLALIKVKQDWRDSGVGGIPKRMVRNGLIKISTPDLDRLVALVAGHNRESGKIGLGLPIELLEHIIGFVGDRPDKRQAFMSNGRVNRLLEETRLRIEEGR